jgi:mRNA-degrading endonuclease RelE of RelBE toxin-antitoxin system
VIRVRFLRSFDESLGVLSPKDRSRVEVAISRLLDYFEGGHRPSGLGLRKLQDSYWEIRAGLEKRVFFALEKDLATFILVGSHDEIRRKLRQ